MIRGGLVRLYVQDVGQAVRFYVETLGMKLVEDGAPDSAVIDAGDGFRVALASHASRTRAIEEVAGSAAATLSSGSLSVGFLPKVPIEEAIAIYENRGVTFDLTREGSAIVAHFRDIDGHPLHLYQTLEDAARA